VAEDSSQTSVAHSDVGGRYALALFELASDSDRILAVEEDLKAIKQMRTESVELRRLIDSPAFNAEQRARALDAVAERAGFQPLTRKFLGLLTANRRARDLPAIIDSYQRMSAERRGVIAAEVVTAVPLSDAQRQGLQAALRQALGKDPEMTVRTDPAILGGLKVRVGSRLFDASVKSRLDQLKFALQRA
jgi:F-type H+-transporting ATPase subunit delta